jgi:superfamily II DNA or RNA helicase
MDKIKVTFLKNRRCVIDINNPYFMVLRNHFSYDNPAARFTKYARIPKRLYSITMKGYCDIGLLWNVMKFIQEEGWDAKLEISQRVKDVLLNQINYTLSEVPNEKYKLRDYQLTSVQNGLKNGGGLCLVGTGGGKSLIISTLMQTLFNNEGEDFKALLVVPNLSLIEQMYDDFTQYGCSFSFSKWSGKNNLDENTNVVIVNTGYLQSSKERSTEFKYFFKTINYLFYDEVHLFGNEPEPKATLLLKEYNYKAVFGFTGSLPDKTYESDKVYGYFGKVFYEKSSKELRDENYLSNIEIKMMYFNHETPFEEIYEKDVDDVENYNNEIDFITYSDFRNDNLKTLVSKLDGNVLILVDRIDQGENLMKVFEDIKGKRIFFIRGSTPVEERSEIIAEMEKNDDIICIAMSKIFSTGISINNLPYAVFYYIGKAWNKTIQSIGRGLRLHENKKVFKLFDLCDNLIFSRKQAEARKKIYDNQKIAYKRYNIYEK